MDPVSVVHVPQVHLEDKLSKAEILRGLITEKLTTAAHEIFAVVERTVAGYEEEVSGLKQEIERQRRQLEVVLQPQVTLCRIGEHGLISLCEEAGAGGGRVIEEQQQRQQIHVGGAAGSRYVSGHAEEKDLGSTEEPLQSSRIDQEDLRAPEHLIPKTGGRSEITTFKKCDPLSLRVCLLKDSKSNKLKKGMLKSGSATGTLTPPKVNTLTPEKIYKSIKSTGKARSALYIQAKTATQQQTNENERKHEATTDSPSTSAATREETGTHRRACSDPVESEKTDAVSGNSGAQQMEAKDGDDGDDLPDVPDPSSDSPAPSPAHSSAGRVGSHSDSDCTEDEQTDDSEQSLTESKSDSSNTNRKRTFLPFSVSAVADNKGHERSSDWKSGDGGEPVSSNIKTQISLQKTLRVCLLKNIQISVLKYGDQHGLISLCGKEGAGGGKVTEEEDQQRQQIHADDTTKSRDVSGHAEEEEGGDEEDAGSAEVPAQGTSLDQGELKDADHPSPRRRRQTFRILRVCLFKKSNCDKLKGAVFKSSIRKVKCHRGMKETDFLNRLRSTFPQLTGPIEAFTTDTSRKLTPLKVKTLTPEEIYKSIKSTGKGRSALYIRVKRTCQIGSKHEATSAITTKHISAHSAADGEENDGDSDCIEDRQTDDEDRKLYSSNTKIRRLRILRVCLLKDMQTNVVKTGVLKSPIRKVKCHRGMTEADFLKRLRSTFPRLTEPFDVFTTDASRILTPLKVKMLTPEKIYKSIKSTGKGRSALYIRAKPADQQRIFEKEHEATTDSPSMSATTSDETGEHRSDPADRVEGRETDSRPQQMEPEDGDDGDKDLPDLPQPTSDSLVPSPAHSAAGREGNHSDNDYTEDRQTGSDQDLMEKKTGSLSSVRKSKRSLRGSVRARPPAHAKGESSDSSMNDDDTDGDWEPDEDDESPLSTRKPRKSLQLRVGMLMDTGTNVHTAKAYKYSVQTVRCPRGMGEESFVHHLSSTFPQLTRPFETFTTDASRKLLPLKLNTLTPEEICRSIKSTGKGRSALYILVKKSRPPAQSNDNTIVGTLPTSATRNDENMPHTSSHNITVVEEKSSEAELQSRDSRLQQQMETEKDQEGGDCEISEPGDAGAPPSVSSAPESKHSSSDEEVEERDTDIDWKPDKNDDEEEGESETDLNSSKTIRKQPVKKSGIKIKQRNRVRIKRIVSCKICGSLRCSVNSLVKHVWTHVDNSERLCGVCGEHSESAEELSSHLHSHLKTHICNICGNRFVSVASLNKHTIVHTVERKYECDICQKTYPSSNALKMHKRVHMEKKSQQHDNKRHICNVCGKSFHFLRSLSVHNSIHTGKKHYTCQTCGKGFVTLGKLKTHEKIHTVREKLYLCHICCKTFHSRGVLNIHLKTHSDEKTLCSECGKELSSDGALKRHMMIHRNERPYSCSECGQAFNSLSTLRCHMRTHTGEKRFTCKICGKASTRQEHLKVHMRTHNGERPYRCTLCDKAFTQSHCLKTHMRSHQVEESSAVDGLKNYK